MGWPRVALGQQEEIQVARHNEAIEPNSKQLDCEFRTEVNRSAKLDVENGRGHEWKRGQLDSCSGGGDLNEGSSPKVELSGAGVTE